MLERGVGKIDSPVSLLNLPVCRLEDSQVAQTTLGNVASELRVCSAVESQGTQEPLASLNLLGQTFGSSY